MTNARLESRFSIRECGESEESLGLGIRIKPGVRTSTDQEDRNIKDKYRVFHNLCLGCPGPRIMVATREASP